MKDLIDDYQNTAAREMEKIWTSVEATCGCKFYLRLTPEKLNDSDKLQIKTSYERICEIHKAEALSKLFTKMRLSLS